MNDPFVIDVLEAELDELLDKELPKGIPVDYINYIEATDHTGFQIIIEGDLIENFLEQYDYYIENGTFEEIVILVDIDRLKYVIQSIMSKIFD